MKKIFLIVFLANSAYSYSVDSVIFAVLFLNNLHSNNQQLLFEKYHTKQWTDSQIKEIFSQNKNKKNKCLDTNNFKLKQYRTNIFQP